MRIEVFTPLLSQMSLDKVLRKLKSKASIRWDWAPATTPGTPTASFLMLEDESELRAFRRKLADHGFSISALSCHGNPLHPDRERAKHDQCVSRATVELARKLEVPVVIDFSGCPRRFSSRETAEPGHMPVATRVFGVPKSAMGRGGSSAALVEHGAFAAAPGVKIAIEMHPGSRFITRKRCRGCARLLGPRRAVTMFPAICSGRASIRSQRFASWGTPCPTYTPRIPRWILRTFHGRACSRRSSIPASESGHGFSGPAGTATERSGGASSSPGSACLGTTTCFD